MLAGSVLDNSLGVLIDRLRGLCDNSDVHPETFHDHEVVYILKDFNGKLTSSQSPNAHYLHNCTVLITTLVGNWYCSLNNSKE